MANNFHIFQHKTKESLHIKLTGDFDGSSASELINLVKNQNSCYQIFINTTEVKTIDPFGLDVLQNRLSEIRDQGPGVIFIGKNIGQSLNWRDKARLYLAIAAGICILVAGYYIFEAVIYPALATHIPFFGVTDAKAALAEIPPNPLQGILSGIVAYGIYRVFNR